MIEIYNDGVRVAKTSKAFNVVIAKELMRGFKMSAVFYNVDNARKYITTTSIIKADGQLFDITGYQMNSGSDNTTSITAEHVSYRLSKYAIPPLYSTSGTIAQIAQNILDESGASAEFTVGECADLGVKAFSMTNEQETSARSALLAMASLGVEVDFDNFAIHFPERIGSDTGKVFKFGHDLCELNRIWDRGNGITYDITIANLQRIPGHSGDKFDVGDDVTVEDYFIGDTIKRRVVAYTKCLDNPTIDTVTLGVFVRDIYDLTTEMRVDINERLVEGQPYNGNRINRTEGFVSETDDGQKKVTMSGHDGFSCWVKEGGVWVKKSWLDALGLISNAISAPDSDIYARIGTLTDMFGTWQGIEFVKKSDDSKLFAVFVANNGDIVFSRGGSVLDGFFYSLEDGTTTVGKFGMHRLILSEDGPEFQVNGMQHGWSGKRNGFVIRNGIITGYY